jgi:hypothetical protein
MIVPCTSNWRAYRALFIINLFDGVPPLDGAEPRQLRQALRPGHLERLRGKREVAEPIDAPLGLRPRRDRQQQCERCQREDQPRLIRLPRRREQ